ncbi:hypothetical protein RRF57_009432 [Xylaria bambusicola]|uniref:Uncharacterized protein n=1 Tax=Xylaria bambusicola TaxID=326684 RepID=A0AAN7UPY3_9PEZI
MTHVTVWIMVAKIPHGEPSSDTCCYQVVWLGVVNSCTGATQSFWIYCTFRFIAWLHNAWLGLHHMHFYDQAEKLERKGDETESNSDKRTKRGSLWTRLPPWLQRFWKLLFQDQHPKVQQGTYGKLRATTLSKYWEWIVTVLITLISVEKFLNLDFFKGFGTLGDWGQSAAFITGIFAVVRVGYLMFLVTKWKAIEDWASIDEVRLTGGDETEKGAEMELEPTELVPTEPVQDQTSGQATGYQPEGADLRHRLPGNIRSDINPVSQTTIANILAKDENRRSISTQLEDRVVYRNYGVWEDRNPKIWLLSTGYTAAYEIEAEEAWHWADGYRMKRLKGGDGSDWKDLIAA